MEKIIEDNNSVAPLPQNNSDNNSQQSFRIEKKLSKIKKFDWIVYKYTIKQFTINAEYKARRHFNKYAQPGTKIYFAYLRNLYRIPHYFNEKAYLEYSGLKDNSDNMSLDDLYVFFINNVNKNYPLDDKYDRFLFNIADDFDPSAYYKRYKTLIDEKYGVNDNYSFDLNDEWETSSQLSDISTVSSVSSIYSTATANSTNTRSSTRGIMLSSFINSANNRKNDKNTSEERKKNIANDEYEEWKRNLYSWYKRPENENRKIYQFYNENKDIYKLDKDYYLFKFEINEEVFSPEVYCRRYNLDLDPSNKEDLYSMYKYYANNINKRLDDEYFKLYYQIPKEFEMDIFIKRYEDTIFKSIDLTDATSKEKKEFVYELVSSLKNKGEFDLLDDKYFRLLYNIPENFDAETYMNRYEDIADKIQSIDADDISDDVSIKKEYVKLYSNYFILYETSHPLDDRYYRMYYKVPNDLDYERYLSLYPSLKDEINLEEENLKEIPVFLIENIKFENRLKLYKFYHENKQRFNLTDNYYNKFYKIKYNIPEDFVLDSYAEINSIIVNKIENIVFDKNIEEEKGEYYEYLYEIINHELQKIPLNDSYYKTLFNISQDFDKDIYLQTNNQVKNKIKNLSLFESYKEINNLLLKSPLDDEYYRKLYDIPNEFDVDAYLKRYPDVSDSIKVSSNNTLEYNKEVYKISRNLLNDFTMDFKYNKIKYNLCELFHIPAIEKYKKIYNINFVSDYENNFKNYMQNVLYEIDIYDRKYLNILFGIPKDFNWSDYYDQNKEYIDAKKLSIKVNKNEKMIKSYCYFVSRDTNIGSIINNWDIIISDSSLEPIRDTFISEPIEKTQSELKNDKILNLTRNVNDYTNVESEKDTNVESEKDTNVESKEYIKDIATLKSDYEKYIINNNFLLNNTRIVNNEDFYNNLTKNKFSIEDVYNVIKHNEENKNIQIEDNISEEMEKNEEEFMNAYTILKKEFDINFEEYLKGIRMIKDVEKNKLGQFDLKNNVSNLKKYGNLLDIYKNIDYYSEIIELNKVRFINNDYDNNDYDNNVLYIYLAYNRSIIDKINFIRCIPYLPNNNILIITRSQDDYWDEIDNYYKNISIIKTKNNTEKLSKLIDDYTANKEYVFIWTSNYIMKEDHLFSNAYKGNFYATYKKENYNLFNSAVLRKIDDKILDFTINTIEPYKSESFIDLERNDIDKKFEKII